MTTMAGCVRAASEHDAASAPAGCATRPKAIPVSAISPVFNLVSRTAALTASPGFGWRGLISPRTRVGDRGVLDAFQRRHHELLDTSGSRLKSMVAPIARQRQQIEAVMTALVTVPGSKAVGARLATEEAKSSWRQSACRGG